MGRHVAERLGVVLTQQYHNIFAAWYTYDSSGKTTWFVMTDGTWSGNTYSGALYSTKGTPVIRPGKPVEDAFVESFNGRRSG